MDDIHRRTEGDNRMNLTVRKGRIRIPIALKPCPFCGGRAKIQNPLYVDPKVNVWYWSVECVVCQNETRDVEYQVWAEESWENRA